MSDERNDSVALGAMIGKLEGKFDAHQARTERAQERTDQTVDHLAKAISTLTAEVIDVRTRFETSALRPRSPSFTPEAVREAMAEENAKQSVKTAESMRPLITETANQTKTLEKQTRILTFAQFIGVVLATIAASLIAHFTQK